jgi:hypothetical protein
MSAQQLVRLRTTIAEIDLLFTTIPETEFHLGFVLTEF